MAALFTFTLKQIFIDRKLWFALALFAFPAGIALLIRSLSEEYGPAVAWEVHHVTMNVLTFHLVIPMVCLLYGTALIGADVEHRTIIYLTTRKLRRPTMLIIRFLAGWLALSLLALIAVSILHLCLTFRLNLSEVAFNPDTWLRDARIADFWNPTRYVAVYLAVAPLALAAYLAAFLTISLVFSKPFVFSVSYAVVFELMLGNVPVAARSYTIIHHVRQTLVHHLHSVRRYVGAPRDIAEELYPYDDTGVWTLLAIIIGLLAIAGTLVYWRELVPSKVVRE